MSEIEKVDPDDKSLFLQHFGELRPDFFLKEIYETQEERDEAGLAIRTHSTRRAMLSAIPMKCKAEECNTPGTMIKTHLGDIAIEDLDPDKHLIVSWDRNIQAIRGGFVGGNVKGYNFAIKSRPHDGTITTIQTNRSQYDATDEHIAIVKWSPKASSAYGVYLMKNDSFWRVGKAKMFYSGGNFGPAMRARGEGAEKLWLLGVYETNVEAMLAEEYFSLKFQASKSLFVNDKESHNKDGLYKWVTQEQLNLHHKSIHMGDEHYENCLRSVGLDVDLPLWSSQLPGDTISQMLGKRNTLYIHSCNVVGDGFMSVPAIPEVPKKKFKAWVTEWEPCTISKRHYTGLVYSLRVEKHHTYFANSIATHNCDFAETCPLQLKGIAPKGKKCPIELNMVADFMENMMMDLNVDPENLIEVSMVRDLVDQEIQHVRKSNLLSREDLIQENVIGLDDENRPIIKKELHLAVELEDKILKRKKEIRNQLLASRESRAKAGQSLVNTAQILSDKFEQLREIDLQRDRLLREKLGTLGQDSYIESQIEKARALEIEDAEVEE